MNKQDPCQDAIYRAYQEGYEDGVGFGNSTYKFPPIEISWLMSDTREKAHGPVSTDQGLMILKWSSVKYEDRASGESAREATE